LLFSIFLCIIFKLIVYFDLALAFALRGCVRGGVFLPVGLRVCSGAMGAAKPRQGFVFTYRPQNLLAKVILFGDYTGRLQYIFTPVVAICLQKPTCPLRLSKG
jgi:hypothetical protein